MILSILMSGAGKGSIVVCLDLLDNLDFQTLETFAVIKGAFDRASAVYSSAKYVNDVKAIPRERHSEALNSDRKCVIS